MPVRIELRTDMFCSFNLLLFLLLTFYLVRPLRQQQHGSPSRFDKQNAISRARDNLVWSGAGVLPSPSFELEDNSHRLLFFLRPVVACLWNIWKFRFLFQLSKRTFFFLLKNNYGGEKMMIVWYRSWHYFATFKQLSLQFVRPVNLILHRIILVFGVLRQIYSWNGDLRISNYSRHAVTGDHHQEQQLRDDSEPNWVPEYKRSKEQIQFGFCYILNCCVCRFGIEMWKKKKGRVWTRFAGIAQSAWKSTWNPSKNDFAENRPKKKLMKKIWLLPTLWLSFVCSFVVLPNALSTKRRV